MDPPRGCRVIVLSLYVIHTLQEETERKVREGETERGGGERSRWRGGEEEEEEEEGMMKRRG